MARVWGWTAEYLSLSSVDREPFRRLIDHWQACQVGVRNLPDQSGFDIELFADIYGNLALVDLSDPGEPAYRVVGTALALLLGSDPTGKPISKVFKRSIFEEIRGALIRSVNERRPLFFRREFQLLGVSLGYDRLLLPMSLHGAPTRVLVALFPTDRHLTHAWQWRRHVTALEEQEARDRFFAGQWVLDVGGRLRD